MNRTIFAVGMQTAVSDVHPIPLDSNRSLLDADIVLFEPTLGSLHSYESYNGRPLISETASAQWPSYLQHWRSEITAASAAGKLVIVYVSKPEEVLYYTGAKTYSGTGKSRVPTAHVALLSSYLAVPGLSAITPKTGTQTRLTHGAGLMARYWQQFARYSIYEAQIEGRFSQVLLETKVGERIVGAMNRYPSGGAIIFLPPLRYDNNRFRRVQSPERSSWTAEGVRFWRALVAEVTAIADVLASGRVITPPPAWVNDPTFRFAQETAYSGRRRPPIPVEGDHRFRSKATTDSNLKATTLGWRAGMVVAIPGMPVAFPGMVVAIRRKL